MNLLKRNEGDTKISREKWLKSAWRDPEWELRPRIFNLQEWAFINAKSFLTPCNKNSNFCLKHITIKRTVGSNDGILFVIQIPILCRRVFTRWVFPWHLTAIFARWIFRESAATRLELGILSEALWVKRGKTRQGQQQWASKSKHWIKATENATFWQQRYKCGTLWWCLALEGCAARGRSLFLRCLQVNIPCSPLGDVLLADVEATKAPSSVSQAVPISQLRCPTNAVLKGLSLLIDGLSRQEFDFSLSLCTCLALPVLTAGTRTIY